ncbi:Hypothetical predicted protein [Olea europaea subsp. europaea]|uniref:Uncharacterized protein n=1 Tax=Olea europaea subsp. europaea TaxID=158383 RepID=A0A8S0QJI2_OLEEU|nr:Hypothetical predicted protein [Olea europaea subsp. europaea]
MMYDKMCQRFATLANMTADDLVRARAILDWIDMQCKQTMVSKSSCGSNVIPSHITQMASMADASQETRSDSMLDLECAKRKGAPRKLRKKCPLESSSKKSKVLHKIIISKLREVNIRIIYIMGKFLQATSSLKKVTRPKVRPSNVDDDACSIQVPQQAQVAMQIPLSYTQLLLGGNRSVDFTQNLHTSNWMHPSSTNPTLNPQVDYPRVGLYNRCMMVYVVED